MMLLVFISQCCSILDSDWLEDVDSFAITAALGVAQIQNTPLYLTCLFGYIIVSIVTVNNSKECCTYKVN